MSVSKSYLTLSAIVALYVGSNLLFAPLEFYSDLGVQIHSSSELLSDLRGVGGSLIMTAILILIGALRVAWHNYSLVLATYLYLSYGVARLYSYLVDGTPSSQYIAIIITELILGGLGFVILFFKKAALKVPV